MRIFLVIESSTNTSLPGNKTWYRNFYESLIELGHDVVFFPADKGRLAMRSKDLSIQSRFSQDLLETFKNENKYKHFDLFFSYLMDGMIDYSVIDEIRKYEVITCNFSCNNVHQFYLVKNLSCHFDYNLHSEKFTSEKFRNIGARSLWWPMASNPAYFKPFDVPRSINVAFVGANYGRRMTYINHLLQNNIDAHVFGPGWEAAKKPAIMDLAKRNFLILKTLTAVNSSKRSSSSAVLADYDFQTYFRQNFHHNIHPPVSDEEQILLYSKSHISLGFLEVYENHDAAKTVLQHLHLREFEAPMCGALYFTGHSEELAEMFEPDREVVVYRNQHELLDKVRFYLHHPSDAEKIRQAGRQRALAEHTYTKRFQQLFKAINI